MATHSDILDPDELVLWQAVRHARGRHSGRRPEAIADVARRRGLDPAQLNADIAEMKARLVAGGVVPRQRFFVLHRDDKGWSAATAPDGSQHCAEIVARADALEFESRRYAYNTAAALDAADTLDAAGRAQLVGLLETIAGGDSAERVTALTADGRELVGARYRNSCGFTISGGRTWSGTATHAAHIAQIVATGAVTHLHGTHQHTLR